MNATPPTLMMLAESTPVTLTDAAADLRAMLSEVLEVDEVPRPRRLEVVGSRVVLIASRLDPALLVGTGIVPRSR